MQTKNCGMTWSGDKNDRNAGGCRNTFDINKCQGCEFCLSDLSVNGIDHSVFDLEGEENVN